MRVMNLLVIAPTTPPSFEKGGVYFWGLKSGGGFKNLEINGALF